MTTTYTPGTAVSWKTPISGWFFGTVREDFPDRVIVDRTAPAGASGITLFKVTNTDGVDELTPIEPNPGLFLERVIDRLASQRMSHAIFSAEYRAAYWILFGALERLGYRIPKVPGQPRRTS